MEGAPHGISLLTKVADADGFFVVFAIVFPAFTGMTAGVGLSGDLANPRKSIPLGTLSATLAGMVVYVLVVVKLAASASPDAMAADQLIMGRIALWGPIIPIGLACATISSAVGSVLVAPRTLQAIANDRVVRWRSITDFLGRGTGGANEPRNATIITGVIAVTFVAAGNVDFVARIISMFFMVTYGSLCAISFLEHFAARPSYRPTFHSRWYLSLLGAVGCLLLMFQMDPVFALLAIIAIALLYRFIRASRTADGDDLGAIFRAVMVQATRQMQIGLQSVGAESTADQWRPSIIMVDGRTFDRAAPLQLMAWLCHRHAVGTYLHFIPGLLDPENYRESKKTMKKLVKLAHERAGGVFVDTIISPSMSSALAQSLQVPGISGMENNVVLFEFSKHDPPEVLQEVYDGSLFAAATEMDILVLRHSDVFFGNRDRIHIWLTWHDYKNASLMILLAYILLGHPGLERCRDRDPGRRSRGTRRGRRSQDRGDAGHRTDSGQPAQRPDLPDRRQGRLRSTGGRALDDGRSRHPRIHHAAVELQGRRTAAAPPRTPGCSLRLRRHPHGHRLKKFSILNSQFLIFIA